MVKFGPSVFYLFGRLVSAQWTHLSKLSVCFVFSNPILSANQGTYREKEIAKSHYILGQFPACVFARSIFCDWSENVMRLS